MQTLETLVSSIDRTHYEWVRDEPTQEELIAQKEAELIAVYQELQRLKDNQ